MSWFAGSAVFNVGVWRRRRGLGLQPWTLLETNDVTQREKERETEGELNNSQDNRSEGSRDMT